MNRRNGATPRSEVVTRSINVEVPEEVYWLVRRCAAESRMSMKDYMAAFCRKAQPLSASEAASPEPGPS